MNTNTPHAGFKSQTAQAVGRVGVNRTIQAVTEAIGRLTPPQS